MQHEMILFGFEGNAPDEEQVEIASEYAVSVIDAGLEGRERFILWWLMSNLSSSDADLHNCDELTGYTLSEHLLCSLIFLTNNNHFINFKDLH